MANTDPDLGLLWSAFTGYQQTAALKTAIELNVFGQIAGGATTIDGLAARCQTAPRGMRALLNFLVMGGFLIREGEGYGLSPTAEAFLVPGTMGYIGGAATFIGSPMIVDSFTHLTDAVRRGGTAVPDDGTLAPDHPVWVDFARAMSGIAGMTAVLMTNLLDMERVPVRTVLDIAAGHGMFGITLARMNPDVQVTGLDWRNVLAVAEQHAREAGVADRYHVIAGSVFEVPFGEGYDLVLLPNILHHFDPPGCEHILAKARAALAPHGRVVIVELVPDDDRRGPADAVRFALVMLTTTPAGDAYTFAEYRDMLRQVGFGPATLHELVPTPARVIIAPK